MKKVEWRKEKYNIVNHKLSENFNTYFSGILFTLEFLLAQLLIFSIELSRYQRADTKLSTCQLASTFDGNTNANLLMTVLYNRSLPRTKPKYYTKYSIWQIISKISSKIFLHIVQINNAYRGKLETRIQASEEFIIFRSIILHPRRERILPSSFLPCSHIYPIPNCTPLFSAPFLGVFDALALSIRSWNPSFLFVFSSIVNLLSSLL